jgi:hypothetical protein
LATTDAPVLQSVLDHYGRASNGLTNRDKSKILDLSGSAATPQWIQATGYTVHDHTQAIKVLGFDLIRTPEGVMEDWPTLIQQMRDTAMRVRTRSCALQGRVLLANSMVLSQLWYKGRLSSPSPRAIQDIRTLGWEVVWGGRTSLKPSAHSVGRRPRHHGGVGFLDPEAQLSALQAMWIARFLTAQPRPSWWAALNQVISKYQLGRSVFATPIRVGGRNSPPACWLPYIKAWNALSPQWNLDMSEWTPAEALCFKVPTTHSATAPRGLRLVELVDWNSTTHQVSLVDLTTTTRRFQAPVRTAAALSALRDGTSAVPPPVLQLALSSSPLEPRKSSTRALFTHIQVAGVLLASLTVAAARRFLDRKKGHFGPMPWEARKGVTVIGQPPSDIWQRLHHPVRTPRHKETFFKFLYNALPLGRRIRKFAPADIHCHYCSRHVRPNQHPPVQTLRHFIFSCPLAQVVWHELRLLFNLPHAVTLQQAAFSWSPHTRVLGRRYGYRLQAGHAVAQHVLWLAHTGARFGNRPAHIDAIRAQFRALLLRHLETLWASRPFDARDQFLEDWSPPLSISTPIKFVHT